jgi:hypothetical protein
MLYLVNSLWKKYNTMAVLFLPQHFNRFAEFISLLQMFDKALISSNWQSGVTMLLTLGTSFFGLLIRVG